MKKIFAVATAATLAFSPVFAANAMQVVPEEEVPQEAEGAAPVGEEAPDEQEAEEASAEDASEA